MVDPSVPVMFGGGNVSSTQIAGTITNNGTTRFVDDAGGDGFVGVDQELFIDGGTTVTLAGSGAVVLGPDTGFDGEGDTGSNASTLVNAADHTIAGSGIFEDLALTNEGTIAPGGGDTGKLLVDGATIRNSASARTVITLAGPNDFDRITQSGSRSTYEAGGLLELDVTGGFVPDGTEVITLVDVTEVLGAFINAPRAGDSVACNVQINDVTATVTYTDGAIVLTNLALDSTPCNAADVVLPFDRLDGGDVSAFVSSFLNTDFCADTDDNGVLDGDDIAVFIRAFLSGCP